jgi:ribosomal protein L31
MEFRTKVNVFIGPYAGTKFNQKALIDVCLLKHATFQGSKKWFAQAEKLEPFKAFLDSYNTDTQTFEDDPYDYAELGYGAFKDAIEAYMVTRPTTQSAPDLASDKTDKQRKHKGPKRKEREDRDKQRYKVAKRARDADLGLTNPKRVRTFIGPPEAAVGPSRLANEKAYDSSALDSSE